MRGFKSFRTADLIFYHTKDHSRRATSKLDMILFDGYTINHAVDAHKIDHKVFNTPTLAIHSHV